MAKMYTLRTKLFGKGINDADYVVEIRPQVNGKRPGTGWKCPYYSKWFSMLNRCYGKAYKKRNPTYKGCYVCKEWLTFTVFKEWMKKQNWKDKALDKDILVYENKKYSPETCIFISQQLNNLLCEQRSRRGKSGLIGVSFHRNRYVANISINGKKKHIAQFKTPEEASQAYKRARSEYLLEWSNNLTSEDTSDIERTKEALIRHAGLLLG